MIPTRYTSPLLFPPPFSLALRAHSHPLRCDAQRLVALVGRIRLCRCLGEGRNPLLVRYFPNGQRRDANQLSPPLDHPNILLEVWQLLLWRERVACKRGTGVWSSMLCFVHWNTEARLEVHRFSFCLLRLLTSREELVKNLIGLGYNE